MHASPESIAQRQLDAYNGHDLEAFMACFSPEVEVYLFPDTVLFAGEGAMRENYGQKFKNPNLHCELVKRMVMGNKVLDQERVVGHPGGDVVHVIAIYEMADNLITRVTFVR